MLTNIKRGVIIYMVILNMKRKALEDIVKWRDKYNRKPLFIFGARQVGKTYLVKKLFAEQYYKNSNIYIDFKRDEEIRDYFSRTVDASKLIEFLQQKFNKKINKNVLIIFDEIQECLPAISSLKYFNQDFPEIPIIATGSMVRIKLKRKSRGTKNVENFFPVGKIDQLYLWPLNFEEYLINSNEILYNTIKNAYFNKIPLEDVVHQHAINELYNYLLIGGMPDCVKTYLHTKSLFEARQVGKVLYDNYLSDMELYQASPEAFIRSKLLFSNIYSELNKENKNIKFSNLEKGSKYREFTSPLDWLITANLVMKSKLVKENVTFPLVQDNTSTFRIYMMDSGMFAMQSQIDMTTFYDNTRRNELSGIFFENYVATEFVSKEIPLFYWKGKNDAEFEFLVMSKNRVIPIDVKKNKGTLNSLEKYKNRNKCDLVIKISKNNYGYDEFKNILTLPIYMTFLLSEDISKNNI